MRLNIYISHDDLEHAKQQVIGNWVIGLDISVDELGRRIAKVISKNIFRKTRPHVGRVYFDHLMLPDHPSVYWYLTDDTPDIPYLLREN